MNCLVGMRKCHATCRACLACLRHREICNINVLVPPPRVTPSGSSVLRIRVFDPNVSLSLTTMSSPIPPTFRWPVQFCIFSTTTTYILSIITGNVSQVDRVWTFLPTIYTAYFALLPLWPSKPLLPLFPYTPVDVNAQVAREWNPRALLMLGLQVWFP